MTLTNDQVDNVCNWLINTCPAYIERYKEIMQVMYSTGCRVSEAVQRSSWTFTSETTWTLKPNKESWERSFAVTSLPENWRTNFAVVSDIIHEINYRKFQYQVNNMTRQFELRSGEKSINSHIFRHNYIRTLSDSGLTPAQVQQQIGHKSLSSTQGYLNAVITAVTLPSFIPPEPTCPLITVEIIGNIVRFTISHVEGPANWKLRFWTYPSNNYQTFDRSQSEGISEFNSFNGIIWGVSMSPVVNNVEHSCAIKWQNQ